VLRPLRTLFILGSVWALLSGGMTSAAELDDYVRRDDPSFAWTATPAREAQGGQGLITEIELTSQTWHGIVWKHPLRVYEAAVPLNRDAMILFITGGTTGRKVSADEEATGLALSRMSGARVGMLHQVPNQPLLDGKTEDTLIAETFVRYLDTKDATWPLLFPMVKSAVRAMDALQAWAEKQGKPVPAKFVVTGASKRGWTTWLTGVAEPRVIAIAPMVIDTLNMKAQKAHWEEVWGKASEQIGDYTSRGLDKQYDTPDGDRLWKMVDPYTYRDRLTLPKFLINGSNDRYWTLDALNIYWNDLQGPKSVVYLPNAGHNLKEHRDYALGAIASLARHAMTGRSLPSVTWKHSNASEGRVQLTVTSTPPARSARVWTASAKTRDFRESAWTDTVMRGDGSQYVFEMPRPESGYIALFGDLEYEVDGVPYHMSTQIRQTGSKLERTE
jgi:PhoPQ-activated pathogenicity-related protein